jgi:histidine ammonia-lyase
MKSSKILEACHNLVRNEIDHAEEDRIFANDIKVAHDIITSKQLIELTYDVAQNEKINLKGPYYDLFGIH